MNILFLFCSLPNLQDDATLFSSLVNEFKRQGHNVFVSAKGRSVSKTEMTEENGIPIIRIQSHDFTGVNSNVKKALGYVEYSLKQVFYTKKLLKGQQIDMIISHSLPPELGYIANRLKRHFKCPFYLIHSDFTWQDAVVYGYFGKNSPIGLYYRYWERKMFKVSDYICAPLKGTINYIRDLYPWIPENRFRICQFWQRPLDIVKSDEVRKKLGLEGKFVVIYGGSVGQAQRVDHMVNLAEAVKEYDDVVFLLLGKGAKLNDIKQMVKDKGLVNFRFLDYMPQQEYLQLLSSCDAGLIILNEVHGSPNFPSKTASYFNLQVPVLAAIDNVTSYGQFLDETQTGLWSISGDVEAFKANLLRMYNNPDLCTKMKDNELKYFSEKMTTEYACSVMSEHVIAHMGGVIPCIRVCYDMLGILKSLFVNGKSDKYKMRLKSQISEYFSCDNILLTSSGRCAIYMILKSLSQKKVIVPAYTCEVVIEACMMAQKEVVYAHVDNTTLNISEYPEIDSDTVVIATHQYGLPCEIKKLAVLCRERGAVLIEDCAGSLGSKIDGRLTGTFGDYGVFSFSASKTLHSPTKGGFIIAKDAEILKRVEKSAVMLSDDAKFRIKHSVKAVGFALNNSIYFTAILNRIANGDSEVQEDAYLRDPSYKRGFYEWQAYIVSKQFNKLDGILKARQGMAKEYDRWIDNPLVQKPVFNEEAVNIRYAVQVKDRESFLVHCRSNGIQVGKGYKRLMCPDSYTVEKEISNNIAYLPFGSLYSHKEIQKVINVVNSYK